MCAGATRLSIGYFPQDATGQITKGMQVVEWLHQFDPDASRQEIHGLLGQMLFSGEDGYKPTDALSGGETARLLFCRIMLQKPNVLILDEPTNHLDLEAINALNVALQKYEGTGTARHARPGPARGSRHPRMALRRPPHHGLQGQLRGIRGRNRVDVDPSKAKASLTTKVTKTTNFGPGRGLDRRVVVLWRRRRLT